MKTLINFLIISLLLSISNFAVASKAIACKKIHWRPYQVYTVKAALHQRTHIILPEPIQGVPVPGNPTLWDVDGENVHLFIKPMNLENKEGEYTTVTAVATSNNSYDFRVQRVENNPDTCIQIVGNNFSPMGAKQGWAFPGQRANRALEGEINLLKSKVREVETNKNRAIEDALMAYRSNVFTRYKWGGGAGFFGGGGITDVWDDGRFTFIRPLNPKKGLLGITGLVEGKEEMADYKYDPNAKLYMVTGLFPKLVMRYDSAKITITRSDKSGD